jgi:tRNA(Arg) A34 adenosine deaminase TadA
VSSLSQADQDYLRRAIALSRQGLEKGEKMPFGAVVAVEGEIVGEGVNSVVDLLDPSAHAEVMALRSAAAKLRRHRLPDGTLYSSSEPCPMCLTASYWARIPRIVFGATSRDAATYGFEDFQLYRELSQPAAERSLREDPAGEALRNQAAEVLREWAGRLPEPVVPKY